MTNLKQWEEETRLAQQEREELMLDPEIKMLEEGYQALINQNWRMLSSQETQERLLQLKTLNKGGYKLFSVYEEPLDMRLMVNDYLETARENYDVPSIPGMLVHLNLNKKQFSELMQLEDQYTQVLSMGMLKIESLLISMGLQKKLESKTLGLILKNYHGLVDKVEEVRTHKHEHSVSVIVKPSIEDKVDGRIIDVEWSESETETELSEVDEDGDD